MSIAGQGGQIDFLLGRGFAVPGARDKRQPFQFPGDFREAPHVAIELIDEAVALLFTARQQVRDHLQHAEWLPDFVADEDGESSQLRGLTVDGFRILPDKRIDGLLLQHADGL